MSKSSIHLLLSTFFITQFAFADNISLTNNTSDIISTNSADNYTEEYTLYSTDFEDGYPDFNDYWAWAPSYIQTHQGYCEFYFNQEACITDNRRERRGCEIVCDFSTQSQGWYAYKLYLPNGLMPRDVSETIITQFFQSGKRNSWAAYIDIEGENLMLKYRYALVDPIVHTIGKLKWDEWQNLIIYFRVGKNNSGCFKIWFGDNFDPNEPTLECDGINFGFANNWLDDTTEDPTPYTIDGNTYTDAIGGKWGFYVQEGGDRTMAMANLKVLSGNPENAFDIMNVSAIPSPAEGDMVSLLIRHAGCTNLEPWNDTTGAWSVDRTQNMGTDKYQNYLQIWTGSTVPAGDLWQDLTLDKGLYTLNVDGIAVSNGNNAKITDESVVLFAQIDNNVVETPFCGTKYNPEHVKVEFNVPANKSQVKVGIRIKNNSQANWVAVDNFLLKRATDEASFGFENLVSPFDVKTPSYNLLGIPVNDSYKGIVIEKGKMFLRK